MDSEKQNLIEVYPRGHGSIYNVFATFYNYDWFKKSKRFRIIINQYLLLILTTLLLVNQLIDHHRKVDEHNVPETTLLTLNLKLAFQSKSTFFVSSR